MTLNARAARALAFATIMLVLLLGNAAPATAQVVPLPPNEPRPCQPYPLCLVVPDPRAPQPTPPTLDRPDPDAPILPLQDDPGHAAHLKGMFTIDDGYGRDLRNYDLFANLPWLVSNPMPTIWLWLANMGFAVGKYALGFSVWFTEWSMTAGVVDWIKAPAQDLEKIWQTTVIGGLKLRELVLLVATCYLGLLFMRGLTTRAWRETVSTIAINVLAIAIITHPVDFLVGEGGVLSLSRDLGADVSAVIMGKHPGGTGNPAAPIGQALIDNLLIAPWETLNYGTPVSGKQGAGSCQYSIKQILDQGPWSGKDSTPARELAGCPSEYGKYNEVADGDRMLGAWLYAIAMILFAILTICLNAIQILAPYFLLFEGLLLSLALIAALIPTLQHQLAYRISSIAGTIAKLLMGMFFIAVMTVLLRALMLADLGPQLVKFAVIDIVVFSGFLFRKRLMGNIQRIRSSVNSGVQRLGRPRNGPKAMPSHLVEPGPHRISRTIKTGAGAFTEAIAPANDLKNRLVTASKLGGKVGSKAVSFTLGAPVSWPAAANRAHTALTARGTAAKAALGRKAGAVKAYASTYAGNIGAAASPLVNVATTAASVLGSRRSSGESPVAPQPATTSTTPAFTGTDLAAPTPESTGPGRPRNQSPDPTPLPPGMLPITPTWSQRLRTRLNEHRS
ncbi:hypothetical protein [Amycolatopsis keratiniphila]|uniref:TrbL/VirB6 plasmid conjugal transfer protein n=1 Tax=Amycolatopsis keratiniphila subsp. keratiniphila TaxID=227715 RepID=A0A1W2M3H7_9PSEU|nr:hypothetical protein [Amycolatopsis keratiniphila]ONF74363.1 hypothetical protein AVR91_0203470 [Amycolatopsis keratiniphila subsp. keratiniphila]